MNPYHEVDKKIVAEIYTSSGIMDNLKVLCNIYGSRFPGTPENIEETIKRRKWVTR